MREAEEERANAQQHEFEVPLRFMRLTADKPLLQWVVRMCSIRYANFFDLALLEALGKCLSDLHGCYMILWILRSFLQRKLMPLSNGEVSLEQIARTTTIVMEELHKEVEAKFDSITLRKGPGFTYNHVTAADLLQRNANHGGLHEREVDSLLQRLYAVFLGHGVVDPVVGATPKSEVQHVIDWPSNHTKVNNKMLKTFVRKCLNNARFRRVEPEVGRAGSEKGYIFVPIFPVPFARKVSASGAGSSAPPIRNVLADCPAIPSAGVPSGETSVRISASARGRYKAGLVQGQQRLPATDAVDGELDLTSHVVEKGDADFPFGEVLHNQAREVDFVSENLVGLGGGSKFQAGKASLTTLEAARIENDCGQGGSPSERRTKRSDLSLILSALPETAVQPDVPAANTRSAARSRAKGGPVVARKTSIAASKPVCPAKKKMKSSSTSGAGSSTAAVVGHGGSGAVKVEGGESRGSNLCGSKHKRDVVFWLPIRKRKIGDGRTSPVLSARLQTTAVPAVSPTSAWSFLSAPSVSTHANSAHHARMSSIGRSVFGFETTLAAQDIPRTWEAYDIELHWRADWTDAAPRHVGKPDFLRVSEARLAVECCGKLLWDEIDAGSITKIDGAAVDAPAIRASVQAMHDGVLSVGRGVQPDAAMGPLRLSFEAYNSLFLSVVALYDLAMEHLRAPGNEDAIAAMESEKGFLFFACPLKGFRRGPNQAFYIRITLRKFSTAIKSKYKWDERDPWQVCEGDEYTVLERICNRSAEPDGNDSLDQRHMMSTTYNQYDVEEAFTGALI